MSSWLPIRSASLRRYSYLFVAVGAGVAAAYTVSVGPPLPTAPLRFEFPVVDFTRRTFIEGEKIDAEAVLENTTGEPLTLTALPKSCGCMTVGASGETDLPMELPPRSRTTIKVRIDTLGKSGIQPFYVSALGQSKRGEPLKATTTIRTMIQAPLLATPEMIYAIVDEREATVPLVRKVSLADQWPGDGLSIKEVTSTAGQRLRYKLEPASGDVSIMGRVMKKRHELELSYTPQPGVKSFDETITIRPDDERAKPVLIRFAGSVKKTYHFSPSGITFQGMSPGQGLKRIVEFRYEPGAVSDLVLNQAPPGVTVREQSRSPGIIRYSVTYTPKEDSGRSEGVALFEIRPDGRQVRLPISILVDATGS